jgi:tripartite-type tricarboxylate transporter receptor subunit TctC
LLLFCPLTAQAQEWPTRQLTIVVPLPPGGSVDTMTRLIQPGLQQALGATVIIENKAGAQGSIGAAHAAKAQPDGGTWLFVFDTHAVNPSLQSLPFDTEKDLERCCGTAPRRIFSPPIPARFSPRRCHRRRQGKPGGITYARSHRQRRAPDHDAAAKRAGITLTHVAHRGGGPPANDAIAGHVDLIIAHRAGQSAGRRGPQGTVQMGKVCQPALADS